MSPEDARALIAHSSLSAGDPQVWADLGCGEGTFTVALASLLPAGSTVHAIDNDTLALARLPARHGDVTIVAHAGDFTSRGAARWPFDGLDGMLMANSLHYVRAQAAFLRGRRWMVAAAPDPARRVRHHARECLGAVSDQLCISGSALPVDRLRSGNTSRAQAVADTAVEKSTGYC